MPKVVIAGSGNAALCAAITARRAGADVLVLERAPVHMRGGNTRHTRDIRLAHERPNNAAAGTYPVDEFFEDVLRVTGGETNRALTRMMLEQSTTLAEWMEAQGVRWQPPLRGTLHLSRTNGFFLGGGKHLVNTYVDTALALGVKIAYGATVRALGGGRRADGVVASIEGREERIACDALVVAAGGFEADVDWLRQYWGESADRFLIRGTPYNTGLALKALYAAGAKPIGDPRGFHSTAVDARTPRFDGGIVTRVDAIPFGIAVNQTARRFYDEGEDLWPKRYAIWGKLIAEQPGQTAYALFDSRMLGRFIPAVYRPFAAGSVAELAALLGLDAATLTATVAEYNAAAPTGGEFRPGQLDGLSTRGLTPPKSNWAVPLDAPPFYGYPLRPGITFTYLGVTVDERARVVREDGEAFENVYAAGECMAGNILGRGYLAGFGLTIGSVFGRIAGEQAAR